MGNICGDYKILNEEIVENKTSSVSRAGVADLSTVELSRVIRRLMLRIQGEHLSADGKRVDYTAIKTSESFSEFLQTVQKLRDCDLATLHDDERKAFFINIYNALSIHGIISRNGLPTSHLGKVAFWNQTAYKIGGLVFGLADIEHGILRNNSHKTYSCGTSPD